MRARSLKRLIICLVTGTLLTISITWFFAYRNTSGTSPQRFRFHPDQPTWSGTLSRTFCSWRIGFVPANDIWFSDYTYMDGMLPYWSRARTRPSSEVFDDPRGAWFSEYGWGWPFICGTTFQRGYVQTSEGEPDRSRPREVVSGFRVADTGQNVPVPYKLLPLRPVYPGLIGNIVCYSLLAYLVLFVFFDVRYIIRLKRGRCPQCGYDLQGADHEACPECGEEIRKGNPA